MRKLTLSEVVNAFDAIDRSQLIEPDLTHIDWEAHDYLAWRDPGSHKTFMVVSLPERNVGLVFRADASARPGMCDICFGVNRRSGATMATVDSWSNPRKSIGLHVCADFDCDAGARGLAPVDHMSETISTGRRIERLQMNLEKFVRSVIAT